MDDDLLARAREGDLDAFLDLVRPRAERLLRLAAIGAGDPETALRALARPTGWPSPAASPPAPSRPDPGDPRVAGAAGAPPAVPYRRGCGRDRGRRGRRHQIVAAPAAVAGGPDEPPSATPPG